MEKIFPFPCHNYIEKYARLVLDGKLSFHAPGTARVIITCEPQCQSRKTTKLCNCNPTLKIVPSLVIPSQGEMALRKAIELQRLVDLAREKMKGSGLV